MSGDDVIVFNNVVKIYGSRSYSVKALDRASFSVPRGVVAGLLGPNGSGKTTSFKLILGFLKPNNGEVKVFGHDPWMEEVEVRRKIGYLPERPIYPYVRVYDFLRHVARIRNTPLSDVDRIVKLVGLQRYIWNNVKGLSRGYLQRLGLAQALIGDPGLLLLDEPTANLDPLSRKQILELIKDLKKELGITIMIATHILPELQEVTDYVIYINRGRVVEAGKIDELTHKYYVEAYYMVRAREPRRIASRLVLEDYVKAVEIRDKELIVKINSVYKDELLSLLSSPEYSVLVEDIRLVTGELGELYEKLSRAG